MMALTPLCRSPRLGLQRSDPADGTGREADVRVVDVACHPGVEGKVVPGRRVLAL